MDQLLLPYLQASDESERQQRLDELLLVHAVPLVRQALRQKLGFYVDQSGINPHNQDAEDLYQEIMTKYHPAYWQPVLTPHKFVGLCRETLGSRRRRLGATRP